MWCHLSCVCSHHKHTQHIKSHWIWSIHIHNVFALVSHRITLPFCIQITFSHTEWIRFGDSSSSFLFASNFNFFSLHSLSQTAHLFSLPQTHTHTRTHTTTMDSPAAKVATKAAIQSTWLVGFIWIRFVGIQRSENLAMVSAKNNDLSNNFQGNQTNEIILLYLLRTTIIVCRISSEYVRLYGVPS